MRPREMAMYNATIAALENIDSSSGFERLCQTLLLTQYPGLNPIGGTADRGRDATDEVFEAPNPAGQKVVLQFSYQADWRKKLLSELKKVEENNLNPDRYVFVTNRPVTGQARDELEDRVRIDYGWE